MYSHRCPRLEPVVVVPIKQRKGLGFNFIDIVLRVQPIRGQYINRRRTWWSSGETVAMPRSRTPTSHVGVSWGVIFSAVGQTIDIITFSPPVGSLTRRGLDAVAQDPTQAM